MTYVNPKEHRKEKPFLHFFPIRHLGENVLCTFKGAEVLLQAACLGTDKDEQDQIHGLGWEHWQALTQWSCLFH